MMPGLLLACCGLCTLCLALTGSTRQRQPPMARPSRRRLLQLLGCGLIAVSFALCLKAGEGSGVASWFGILSICGVLLTFARAYAPGIVHPLVLAVATCATFRRWLTADRSGTAVVDVPDFPLDVFQ